MKRIIALMTAVFLLINIYVPAVSADGVVGHTSDYKSFINQYRISYKLFSSQYRELVYKISRATKDTQFKVNINLEKIDAISYKMKKFSNKSQSSTYILYTIMIDDLQQQNGEYNLMLSEDLAIFHSMLPGIKKTINRIKMIYEEIFTYANTKNNKNIKSEKYYNAIKELRELK